MPTLLQASTDTFLADTRYFLGLAKNKQVDNSNLVVLVVCHLVTYTVAPVLPVVTVVCHLVTYTVASVLPVVYVVSVVF